MSHAQAIPEGFTKLSDVDETILHDVRYAGKYNFIGRRIIGYEGKHCYLKQEVAEALSRVQASLKEQAYGLLVFDCYRPQRSVDDFMQWTKKPKDQKMKEAFYPNEKKSTLVKHGYIAPTSGHSKGNTVDLTLIRLDKNKDNHQEADYETSECKRITYLPGEVDMGTPFDCFSESAATKSLRVSETARQNRLILKKAMTQYGFKNYSKEWWHYSYPNSYKNSYQSNFQSSDQAKSENRKRSQYYDFIVR